MRPYFFILTISLFLVPTLAAARDENPIDYTSCQSDSECVTIPGPCGEDRAVNTHSAEQMMELWKKQGREAACPIPPEAMETNHRLEAVCENRQCVMK